MATVEQLSAALIKADAAGDAVGAKMLADAIRAQQSTPDMYASGNVQKLSGSVPHQGTEAPNLGGAVTTLLEHGISDLPVVGPLLQGTGDAISNNLQGLFTGQDPKALQAALDERRRARDNTYPLTALSGGVIGNVAALGPLGATEAGAQALGLTGKLLPRIGNAALSSGALSAADASVRGNNPLEAGAIGGAIGGAIPLVGSGVSAAIKGIGRRLAPTIGAIKNPAAEASRRVGIAQTRDATANPGQMMTGADEGVAAQAGIPLVNVDRGGETVRALTRSVANQSPEARAVIEKTASDRFAGQGARASQFVERLAGGNADDLALKEGLEKTKRFVNSAAYKKAEGAPAARAIWSPNIRQMMQSDIFRGAIKEAETVGTDYAAIHGGKAVRNPFSFREDGTVTLRKMPDGSTALPNLQFWDIVQRNLRKVAETAKRAGDNETSSRADQLRRMLNGELDTAVPDFKAARQGAAAFFGAEDAIDAGKLFARNGRAVPEAKAAFGKFTAPEQKAFSIGYASELIDRIKAAGDRTNVINQVFKTPASREMVELVFGKGKARELEAYIRVEDIADKLRGAMGNSTTARQLMELGLGGGAGFVLSGGDWKGALGGAALTKGARYLGQKVDDRIMQEVAKLLLSNDPAAMKKAVFNAAMSEQWMKALDAWGRRLGVATRGAGLALAS